MKTKKLLIILIFTLLLSVFFGACAPAVELPKPENLQVVANELIWDEVENAASYIVCIDETEYEVNECYYGLSKLTEAKTYKIKVKAKGDGKNYEDSKWATTTYQVETPTAGLEYTLINNGTEYEVARGEANIKGRVVIPDTYKGLPVTRIASYAFGKDGLVVVGQSGPTEPNIKEVRLPAGLKTIGDSAFVNCINLTKVEFPLGLTTIEEDAFDNCGSLKNISIPDSVTYIGGAAFNQCDSFTEVTIPKSVTYIGEVAFAFCDKLSQVNMSDEVEYMGTEVFKGTPWYEEQPDGFVCIGKILYRYKGDMPEGTEITSLPEGVTKIAGGAFKDCIGFTSITIQDGIDFIGGSVFQNCTSLINVRLPDGLVEIPNNMYEYCTELTEINIPESVKSIGAYAFYGCAKLTNIVIPDGVISIGSSAFGNCSSLTEIILPDSVTEIRSSGFGVFSNCTSLTNIVLPKGITAIPNALISGCTNLTSIVIPEGVTSIGSSAFNNCANLTNIVIPEGVTSIGDGAFNNCAKLASIVIPKSVINIGKWTFGGCESLAEIYYGGTEETWSQIEFELGTSKPTYYGATVYYYSETQPEEEGNYWHYDVDGVTPVIWTKEN